MATDRRCMRVCVCACACGYEFGVLCAATILTYVPCEGHQYIGSTMHELTNARVRIHKDTTLRGIFLVVDEEYVLGGAGYAGRPDDVSQRCTATKPPSRVSWGTTAGKAFGYMGLFRYP